MMSQRMMIVMRRIRSGGMAEHDYRLRFPCGLL